MKLGIDLGTSYSSVAAEVNGKIEMIKVATGAGAFGDSYSMPTAVCVDQGSMLLGQAAYNKRKLAPASFKSEFKRDFGTTTPYILGGEEYLPEQLYTEFFLYFKNMASEQMGEKVERVYITHPANYGNNKKRLIEKAASNAGLFDVVLVDEPTAAAAGYAQKSRIEEGDILLVYDLGGGTFDVALIKKTSKGYVHLTEPLGISLCGGVDFDRAIFDDVMHKLEQNAGFDIERLMQEKRFTATLSEICIQIKHQLTQADSHTEPIAVGFDYFDYTIARTEFEDLIRPYVANTCEKVKDLLKNSGLVASDIDKVLLVGGSSRIPLVRKMVQETLQKDISLDADPELAICQGAVCLGLIQQADVTENKNEKIVVKPDVAVAIEEKQEAKMKVPKQEAQLNKKGNTAGNLANGGKMTKQGDWIYYSNPGDGKLFKMLTDGSAKTQLYDEPSFHINVIGDWIYFASASGLCKIKTDGSGRIVLSDKVCRDVQVVEDSIYFAENHKLMGTFNLYRMKTDGSGKVKLNSDDCSELNVAGNWIFYIKKTFFSDDKIWYKIRTDGSRKTELKDAFYLEFNAVDDWVYYKVSGALYKMKTDQREGTLLYDGKVTDFNVASDWIYYTENKELYKMRINGQEKIKIMDLWTDYVQLYVMGDWIYLFKLGNSSENFKIRLDGTGKQAAF